MIPQDRIGLINGLQAKIGACIDEFVTDQPFAVLDFPDIRNVGDSAIWLGEVAYLLRRSGRMPAYTCTLGSLSSANLEAAVPAGPIFIHGGGNFGDIWPGHQKFREHVLERWSDRLIIQFPQSIHYQSPEQIDQTARIIARHRQFILLVRDEVSLDIARKKFDCDVRLCPDMAFCIGDKQPLAPPDLPVLAMLRQDKEQTSGYDFSGLADLPVEDWITEKALGVRLAKTIGAIGGLPSLNRNSVRVARLQAAAEHRFRRGVRQLSRGRAIVTDRLHVHIISLLLGKPHAVLDNNYGKIGRFMAAFTGESDLAFKSASLHEAVAWAREQALDDDRQVK